MGGCGGGGVEWGALGTDREMGGNTPRETRIPVSQRVRDYFAKSSSHNLVGGGRDLRVMPRAIPKRFPSIQVLGMSG